MAKKTDQTVLLFKKKIFSSSKLRLLKTIQDKVIRTKSPLVVFTPNPEQLVLAQKDAQFSANLDRADYLIPDGIGLIWAASILNLFGKAEPISSRISGIDLATDFLEWAKQASWPVLLLGGRDYHQAKNQSVQLNISGQSAKKLKLQWLMGYQQASQPTKQEEQLVVKTIKQLKPKMVLVAFGAPQQEQWVVDHLPLLKQAGVKVVLVVGGSFDVLLGKLKRAPLIMRGLGLEWLFRLIQEPRRWRRQLALLEFMGMTLEELLSKKSA